MAWQARFYWVVKSLHDPLDGRALDRYPVIGCSPFGWLLRMGSRSSELRGPTVLAQNSQGSQMVPHPQPATTDFRGVHSSGSNAPANRREIVFFMFCSSLSFACRWSDSLG